MACWFLYFSTWILCYTPPPSPDESELPLENFVGKALRKQQAVSHALSAWNFLGKQRIHQGMVDSCFVIVENFVPAFRQGDFSVSNFALTIRTPTIYGSIWKNWALPDQFFDKIIFQHKNFGRVARKTRFGWKFLGFWYGPFNSEALNYIL